jgi:hypothetical protein
MTSTTTPFPTLSPWDRTGSSRSSSMTSLGRGPCVDTTSCLFFSVLFCFWYWVFELRVSPLLGRPSALFAVVILEIVSYFSPRLAWPTIFLFSASWSSSDDRHIPPYPPFPH